MLTTVELQTTVSVSAWKCDRCGETARLTWEEGRPRGWVAVRIPAAAEAAALDYCSEECAAQALAARVGKVLA